MGPLVSVTGGVGLRANHPGHVDLVAGVTPVTIPCGGFFCNGVSVGKIMRFFHWI